MGLCQIIEVVNQPLGPGARVEWFEHVLAHKISEVADGLHGHGLTEQIHRLLRLDPETPAKVLAVLGKSVAHPGAPGPQPAAQHVHVAAQWVLQGNRPRDAVVIADWPAHNGAGVGEHARRSRERGDP